MSTNPIAIYEQTRFVSHLFSLTGPRENLPQLLSNLLEQDELEIRQKLEGQVAFTEAEIALITDNFKNAILVQKTA